MRLFTGCVRADEIAMTRKGANPHTTVLVAKTAADPAQPTTTPEQESMDAAELQKTQREAITTLLTFDDVQKAYYLGLDEAGQTAFLAKAAPDRKLEADTAKAAKEIAEKAAEAAKSGLTAVELERQKAFDKLSAENAELRGEMDVLKAKRIDDELEKRARDEFRGFPGGEAEAVKLLKVYAALPEPARLASENLMKSQANFARMAGVPLGLSEEEAAKSMPAAAEVTKKAQEVAKAKGVSLDVAKGMVLEDDDALFERAMAEEQAARGGVN